MRNLRFPHCWLFPLAVAFAFAVNAGETASTRAQQIFKETGFAGGLIVHLNCGDGVLTTELGAEQNTVVQGLATSAEGVEKARATIHAHEAYSRISVDSYEGRHLPYMDNLVNLIVAETLGDVTREEAMRVLVPDGALCVRQGEQWLVTRKPRPVAIDEWTHFLHGPDNNPVALDTVVGPPSRVQWVAGPTWSRNHEATPSTFGVVTAAGRLFYVQDQAPSGFYHEKLPAHVALVARDAFNGIELWRHPLPDWWKPQLNWFATPDDMQRRLVVVGHRVYVTLGLDAPVSEIDVATGKLLRVFKETEHTREIVVTEGVLLALSRDPSIMGTNRFYKGGHSTGPGQGVLRALDLADGRVLWKQEGELKPLSLAVSTGRAFVVLGSEAQALDLKTGKGLWTAPLKDCGMLIAQPNVVVVTGSPNTVLDAATGKSLWTNMSARGVSAGACSTPDAFVIDDLVWFGLAGAGYDPLTGKELRKAQVSVTQGHHPRCYMRKATSRFILGSKRGVEFIDVTGKEPTRRYDWVRGVCRLGFVPANGLMYFPPSTCRCYTRSQLHGFYALASTPAVSPDVPLDSTERLQKGPAYGASPATDGEEAKGWTAFRGGPLRNAVASESLGSDLKPAWSAKLGGRISAPVVSGNAVYLSVVDACTVLRLDAASGSVIWRFTAGGRVETPPSLYHGSAIFGCTDGWVYAVDAEKGNLRWRFRCAPADQRLGAMGRLESVWPVFGVLIQNKAVYAAAGRNSMLDGGIALYALDPDTGSVRQHVRIANCPDAALLPGSKGSNAYAMPGVNGDVLIGDGQNVYLRHLGFDGELKPLPETYTATEHIGYLRGTGTRLYASAGLLDSSMNNRTYWLVGQNYGNLLCFDREQTYGVKVYRNRVLWSLHWEPGDKGVLVYRAATANESPKQGDKLPTRAFFGNLNEVHDWERMIRVVPKAMALVGKTLIYAGLPDVIDEKDPYAAYEGRRGGVLVLLDSTTGKTLSEIKLDVAPAFDGLAVANGRLYLAMQDGSLRCFEPVR